MKPIVITLGGEAHSGKDTVANYLMGVLESRGLKVIQIALADRLKYTCQRLIKLFYNLEIPIEDFYDWDQKQKVHPEYPQFAGQPFKLRTIMQLIGSEVFRHFLWDDIWCDYVNREYLSKGEYQVYIISDCRFQNEVHYYETMAQNQTIEDCISCRIDRPTVDNELITANDRSHQSEINISKLLTRHVINNDSTFEHLYKQIFEKIIADLPHSKGE
jgi:hypothetical protein